MSDHGGLPGQGAGWLFIRPEGPCGGGHDLSETATPRKGPWKETFACCECEKIRQDWRDDYRRGRTDCVSASQYFRVRAGLPRIEARQ